MNNRKKENAKIFQFTVSHILNYVTFNVSTRHGASQSAQGWISLTSYHCDFKLFSVFYVCSTYIAVQIWASVWSAIREKKASGQNITCIFPTANDKPQWTDYRWWWVWQCGWFSVAFLKPWIINTKCPDFSYCNEWESWACRVWITIMALQSCLSIAQMCYLQHVQLYSQIREELNQELPSHYAWGQWLSLLHQEGQILLPKICNLATEQLIERMRSWPAPNSWHCRWSRQGLILVLSSIRPIYWYISSLRCISQSNCLCKLNSFRVYWIISITFDTSFIELLFFFNLMVCIPLSKKVSSEITGKTNVFLQEPVDLWTARVQELISSHCVYKCTFWQSEPLWC